MTDEERQRQMDFILNQQAQFTVNMQKLEERAERADERAEKADARAVKADQRLDRLERVLTLAIRAGKRERKETRERFNALIDSQLRTDERLDRLAAIVERHIEGGEQPEKAP